MRRGIVLAASLVVVAYTSPLAAQRSAPEPILTLTPYAGYMVAGTMVEGPLGTTLSNANSPLVGAQAGLNLTRNIAIVGNVGYTSGDLQVGVPFLGGMRVGSSSLWLYDAGLQFRLPLTGRLLPIAPWIQVGAGAMHFDFENSLVETSATNAAFNAGVGADIDLTPSIGLRLMAKDYVGKFDFEQAMQLDVVRPELSHNWAFGAGITLSF